MRVQVKKEFSAKEIANGDLGAYKEALTESLNNSKTHLLEEPKAPEESPKDVSNFSFLGINPRKATPSPTNVQSYKTTEHKIDDNLIAKLMHAYPEIKNVQVPNEKAQIELLKNARSLISVLDTLSPIARGVHTLTSVLDTLPPITRAAHTLANDFSRGYERRIKERERNDLGSKKAFGETHYIYSKEEQASLREKIVAIGETLEDEETYKGFLDQGMEMAGSVAQDIKSAIGENAWQILAGAGIGAASAMTKYKGGDIRSRLAVGAGGAAIGAFKAIPWALFTDMAWQYFGEKTNEIDDINEANGTPIYSKAERGKEALSYAAGMAAFETYGEVTGLSLGGRTLTKVLSAAIKSGSPLSIKQLLGRAVGTYGRAVVIEDLTEGLQNGYSEFIRATFEKSDGRGSFSNIPRATIEGSIEALPGTVVLGVVPGVGSLTSGVIGRAKFNRLSPEKKDLVKNQMINQKGATLLENIADDTKKNPIAKSMPKTYGEIIQATSKAGGISEFYVNVNQAVATDEGRAALKDLVDKKLISEEELNVGIETDTPIKVEIGSFAQTSSELNPKTVEILKGITQYSETGMSDVEIANRVKEFKETPNTLYDREYVKAEERKEQFTERYLSELDPEEKAIAKEYIRGDKFATLKAIKEDMMGLRVAIIQSVGIDTWNQSFEVGKEQGIHNIDSMLQLVAQKEGVEYMAALDSLKDLGENYKALGNVALALEKVNESDYIKQGMSEDAVKVYDELLAKFENSSNPTIRNNAKNYALLHTSHAEVMANELRKSDPNATALTYHKKLAFEIGGKYKGETGYKQETENAKEPYETRLEEHKKRVQDEIEKFNKFLEEHPEGPTEGKKKPTDKWIKNKLVLMDVPVVMDLVEDVREVKYGKTVKKSKRKVDSRAEVQVTYDVLHKVLKRKHGHQMDASMFQDLIDGLVNPILIVENTKKGKPINGFVFVTDLIRKDATVQREENQINNLQVPISFFVERGKNANGDKMYLVKSVFARESDVQIEQTEQIEQEAQVEQEPQTEQDKSKATLEQEEQSSEEEHNNQEEQNEEEVENKQEEEKDEHDADGLSWYLKNRDLRRVDYYDPERIHQIFPDMPLDDIEEFKVVANKNNRNKKVSVDYKNKKITASNEVSGKEVPTHYSRYFESIVALPTDLVNRREEYSNKFYQNDKEVLGLTSIFEDGERLINIFETANASTFIHESAHLYLEDLRMLASMENASEQIKKDWETVVAEIGYKENATLDENRGAHEDFARKFEIWVRDGKAPNETLKGVFHTFRRLLCKVYKTIQSLGKRPSEELQAVMGRMVATQESIDAWSHENSLTTNKYAELYKDAPIEDQQKIKRQIENIQNEVYENVREKFADEFNGNQEKLWKAKRKGIKEKIEEALANDYEVYKVRRLYEKLGDAVLTVSPYKSFEELKKAEKKALGNFRTVVKNELAAAKEEFLKSNITREEVYALADEWMLTKDGQAKLIQEETNALRKITNHTVADAYKRLTMLDEVNIESESFDEDVKQIVDTPIERLRKKTDDKVAKLKETQKEKIENLKERNKEKVEKLKEKNKEKLEEQKAKLKERILMARQLRDVKLGKLSTRIEEQRAKVMGVPIDQVRRWKIYQNKIMSVGQKTDRALARGDINAAIQYKHEQFNAVAMARVSYELNTMIQKKERAWKRMNKMLSRANNPKKLNAHARYYVQHLLYQMGVVSKDGNLPSEGFSIDEVLGFLYPEDVLENSSIEEYSMDERITEIFTNGKPFSKLTVEEFQMVSELLDALYKRGMNQYRSAYLVDRKGNVLSFEQAAKEIVDNSPLVPKTTNPLSRRNVRTGKDKFSAKIRSAVLELTRADVILERIDGFKKGQAYHLIYETVSRATSEALRAQVELGKRYKKIFSRYTPSELHEIRNERKYNVGTVQHCTKEQVIAMALNLGTKDNRQRLEQTLKIPVEQAEIEISNILSDKDIELVKDIWGLYDEWFDARSKVEERTKGVPIKKVEGVKFMLKGNTIQGKYYPIVYDYDLDIKANNYGKDESLKLQMSSNAPWGVGMSATKKRMANVKNRMLALNFNVITSTMDEAVRHVYLREPLIEVKQLLERNEVQNHIVNTLGIEQYEYLQKWLRDCWAPELLRTNQMELWLNRLKRNTTFAIIAYRTQTAALNATNIFPMINHIGALETAKALRNFYGLNRRKNSEFVFSKSVMMENRNLTLDRDLKRAMKLEGEGFEYSSETGKQISKATYKAEEIKDKINDYAYMAIAKTDLMLAMPLWKHAYDKKVNELVVEGNNDMEMVDMLAVSAADSAVKEVFGSGTTKDAAGFQRSKSFINNFTAFYTYSGTMLNILIKDFHRGKDTGNWAPLIISICCNVILTATMEYAIKQGISKLCGNDTDDVDDIPKGVLSRIIENGAQGFPIIRDVISQIASTCMGEPIYGRGANVPMLSAGDKLYDVVQNIKSDRKTWIDVGRSVSQTSNRLIGFSDTVTDGFWAMVELMSEGTEKSAMEAISSIIFDKKVKKR